MSMMRITTILFATLFAGGCAQQYGATYSKSFGEIMSGDTNEYYYRLVPYVEAREINKKRQIDQGTSNSVDDAYFKKYPKRRTGAGRFSIISGVYIVFYFCGNSMEVSEVEFMPSSSGEPNRYTLKCR